MTEKLKLVHQQLKMLKLKLQLLSKAKLKRLLFSNTKQRKMKEENKDTDNLIHKLKLKKYLQELQAKKKKMLNN